MKILCKVCFSSKRMNKWGGKPVSCDIHGLINTCLHSIIKQIENDDEIIFFVDGEQHSEYLHKICNYYKVNYKTIPLLYNDLAKTYMSTIGYIEENIQNENENIYLVDDDYFHFEGSLIKIKNFLIENPFYFCHPIDYPNLYESDERFIYNSKIIISANHHWRTIKNTTATIAFTKKLYNSKKHIFRALKEEIFMLHGLNLLYVFNECYSPIPSLTSHIEMNCLPYTIDTINEFDKLNKTIIQ